VKSRFNGGFFCGLIGGTNVKLLDYRVIIAAALLLLAVGVLLAFNTGAVAGLDLLVRRISTASGSERDSISRHTDQATLATARGTDSAPD